MMNNILNFRDDKTIEQLIRIKDYDNLFIIANKAFNGDKLGNDVQLYKKILKKLYVEKYKKAYHPLGLYYLHGENNSKKGIQILEEASNLNCVESLNCLGNFYFTGYEVEENLEKAIGYFEKAALLNDSSAIESISGIYLYGNVPYSSSKSLDILNRGKNRNIKESILCLSEYYKKNGVDWDVNLSLKYREDCLDESNITEVRDLALEYLKRSSSTDKYNKRMLELFEIASKNDDLDSLNLLGYFYFRGDIVTQDLNKSIEYYEKAQSLGDPLVKREINIINKKLKELNA